MDQPIKTWILTKSNWLPLNRLPSPAWSGSSQSQTAHASAFRVISRPATPDVGMQVSEKKTEGVIMGTNSSLARCFGLWANTSVLPAAGAIQAARKCQPAGCAKRKCGVPSSSNEAPAEPCLIH
ncbi:Putative protein of unknown function [Podospora comata]|uniref:Uncharacterized protein n=1 Tax=Podospora comata TaxID=48703 RepID=A0ABY6SF04_PODCO|nr:Putative protein of unknown function [Podospora comata]